MCNISNGFDMYVVKEKIKFDEKAMNIVTYCHIVCNPFD